MGPGRCRLRVAALPRRPRTFGLSRLWVGCRRRGETPHLRQSLRSPSAPAAADSVRTSSVSWRRARPTTRPSVAPQISHPGQASHRRPVPRPVALGEDLRHELAPATYSNFLKDRLQVVLDRVGRVSTSKKHQTESACAVAPRRHAGARMSSTACGPGGCRCVRCQRGLSADLQYPRHLAP